MGSPNAFEHRRHELILETPGASAGPVVSDAEVLGSFLKSVEPGESIESSFSSLKKKMSLKNNVFMLTTSKSFDFPSQNYFVFLVSVETGDEDVFFFP